MKKKETVGFKHIVCALLVCALLLMPSLTLAASATGQAAVARGPELREYSRAAGANP